jgi:hypothetical protein
MGTNGGSVRCAGAMLGQHRHICAFFNSLDEQHSDLVMDIMRTHPVVIIGEVLQESPFFVPPDQFLLEIRERRRSARAR